MHPSLSVLAFLSLLAACSTAPGVRGHREDAASHLVLLRDLAAQRQPRRAPSAPAVQEQSPQDPPGRQAPEPSSQEPKIDQLEPPRPGGRRFRGAPIPLALVTEIGLGVLEIDTSGATLHDRVAVQQLRLGIEGDPDADAGPALHLRLLASDDDLFAGSLTSDGVAPRPADARAVAVQAFPHLRVDGSAGSFHLVTRVGVAVDLTELDHRVADVERTWLTVGARVQTEPRLPLAGGEGGGQLELFGRLGAQLGFGRFEEDYAGGHGADEVAQWGLDAGLGLRWRQARWSVGLGYEVGRGWLGETDTALFGRDVDVGLGHQVLFLGGSVTF